MLERRIILASQSPRRAQLLTESGFVFEQRSPPFVDPAQPEAQASADVAEIAKSLAVAKARSVADLLETDPAPWLVIGADTICVDSDGALRGTPQTADEARAMIRRFFGVWHRVVSGVGLVGSEGEQFAFADEAEVRLGAVGDGELDAYIAGGDWQGKAGGYNLLDRRKAGWPIEVRGDPTTVVGLPMGKLLDAVRRWPATRVCSERG